MNSLENLSLAANPNLEVNHDGPSRSPSQALLQRQAGSINEQIKAFLKNDPSVTKLGDIGTIFGGGSENQIAQSVKRLGSMGKFMGGESTTMASSVAK